jgi:hypothetical protein
MSKISTYEVAPLPKLSDKLIGTSVGGEIEDATYNFTLQELLDVFLPVIPANNLQGILDFGNTATQDINLFGTINTTNLNVTDTANIYIAYLNEETHIVGSVFDSLDLVGTAGQVLTSTGEGVEWYTLPPIFTPNLQQVLEVGNTADIDIVLDANIQALDVTSETANVTTQLTIQGTVVDYNESTGTAGQVLESTVTGVQWTNLPVYSATSPLLFNSATGVFSIQVANSTQGGYLTANDWVTFNGKQDAGSYITALTGEATATGPGSVPITLNNASVIAKVLTGLNVSGGSISASDSILTAFGKVQNQINGLVGGVQYQGTWNADTNTPTLTSSVGTQGHFYIVNVAGNTNLNGITDWKVGDWAIFNNNSWTKVDNTESVTSVNGQVGAVSLTTDDIPEGSTNLYYLNSRARGALSFAAGSGAYNSLTGVITIPTDNNQILNGAGYITLASLSATAPLTYNNLTGAFGIPKATTLVDGYLSATDWTTFNNKQNYLGGTGLVKSTAGTITYITDNSDNWNTAYNRSIISAAVTGTTTKTLTLNEQDGNTITASWTDLDTGLTSVGVSMPSAFSVANSPLTANGTIAVTGAGTSLQYIDGTGALQTFPGLTGFVPYTGATTNVNLGTYGLISDYLQLNNTPTSVPTTAGTMSWNNTDGTLDIRLKGGNVTLQVGEETVVRVVNKSGVDLLEANYQVVRVRNEAEGGAQGQRLAVVLARANTKVNHTGLLGIVTETINSNQEGFVTNFGIVRDIDTTGDLQGETWADGDVLWLSETTAGALTNVEPTTHPVQIGYVTYAHANNGKIFVYLQEGVDELDELHDVNIVDVANNDGIFYNSTTSFWENKTIAEVLGYTPANAATNIATTAPLQGGGDLSANRTFSITQSGASSDGYLSSTDWNTFNNKQPAGSYVPTSRLLSINGTQYDLSADRSWSVGTVTSVAALTLGTTGTDLSSSVANGTTTPVITLNVPTASAANRGALSAADWSTFNTKVGSVTASSPLASSGGSTPNITIQQASGSQDGYLSSTDWTTFNNKQAAGNYITSLTGEATATGPGAAAVTLNNASVTGKVLTGVNITGGSISASDSILTAFGKVQNQINGLIGSTIYQGTWNAATNTPALASGVGTRGYYYIVNVAGSTNLDGITDWFVGDWAIFDGTAWQQVDNTDAVVSVNGQTGAVSLTTDNIPEGATNQYFLNSRARAALSFAAGSGAYNSTTGVITIPTNNNQITNGANYITLASLSGTAPIQYNSSTGAISITQSGTASNGYLSSTDWNTFNNKQSTITLTTTGTSGAATLVGTTLNIPQYQSVLTNPVTGSGTNNTIAKFTSTGSTIGDSGITDNGSTIGMSARNMSITNPANNITFTIANTSAIANSYTQMAFTGTGRQYQIGVGNSGETEYGVANKFYLFDGGAGAMRLTMDTFGNFAIGGATNTDYKLFTYGQGYFQSASSPLSIEATANTTNTGYAAFTIKAVGRTYVMGVAGSAETLYTLANKWYVFDSTASAVRMVINTSGQLGVGTVSPTQMIQAGNGTQSGNHYVRVFGTAADLYMGQSAQTIFGIAAGGIGLYIADSTYAVPLGFGTLANQRIIFGTANVERGTFLTNGYFGVGTNNPSQVIEASQSFNGDSVIQITNTNTGSAAVAQIFASNGTTRTQFYHTGTNYVGSGAIVADQGGMYNAYSAGLAIVAANAAGVIRFATGGGVQKAMFDASGQLGINVTPTNLLHLAGASATPSLRLGSVSAGFYWDIGRENATTGDFVFNNANGGSSSERVRITILGDVGIGTQTPNFTTTGRKVLDINGTSTSLIALSVGGTPKGYIYHGGTDMAIANYANGGILAFNTNNGSDLTRMTLNSAGNLGLGIVPNANWSLFTTLQLGGNTYAAVASSNTYLNVSTNTYYDGTNFRYITTGVSTRYQQSGGGHYWFQAASGTAGAVITHAQSLILDANGNLGLGTSVSPSNWGGGTEGALQIKNAGMYGYADYEAGVTANAYYNGGWLRIAGSASSMIIMNNNITLRVAASGAAGSAITWISGLNIDNAGAAQFHSSVTSRGSTTSAGIGVPTFMGAGEFMATGTQGGYFFENRSGGVSSGANWGGWYYSGTTIRLYNGSTDIFSINGSSGAAAFPNLGGTGTRMVVADANGLLSTQAIPSGGGISGSGTTNYITKWTGGSAVGNSIMYDNGSSIGIGATTFTDGDALLIENSGVWNVTLGLKNTGAGGRKWNIFSTNTAFAQGAGKLLIYNATGGSNAMVIDASNNVGIGTINPSFTLDVNGTGRFAGQLNGVIGVNVGGNALGADRMFQVSGTAFTSGTTQFGVVVNPSFSGTITNVFGVYAGNNFGTGTITNSYNLYIEGTSAGSATVTNRWGIYQAGGSDKNYFAGNVGIGTNNPLSILHIQAAEPTFRITDSTDGGVTFIGSTGGFSYIRPFSRDFRFLNAAGASMLSISPSGVFTFNGASASYTYNFAGGSMWVDGGQGGASPVGYNSWNTLTFNDQFNDVARGPNKIVTYGRGGGWVAGIGIHNDTQAYYAGGTHKFYRFDGTTATLLLSLDSSGNLTATGGFFEGSDMRIKELIQDNHRVAGIENIKPKLYKKHGKIEVGYFAQDFESILPNAISIGENGYLSLSYREVHTAKIAIIEDEVDVLKKEVAELKVKLQKYEA